MRKLRLVLVGAVVCLAADLAMAQSVPGLISYQGRLTDSGGAPVNGTVAMTFSLWDGATQVWSESQAVGVDYGIYSVLLGDSVPLPEAVFADPSLFLEVTVGGETMSPRTPLTSVAYAMEAALLGGHPSSDFSLDGHTHDFGSFTGTVSDAQVPDTITVLYAAEAGTLDGMLWSDFALVGHTHNLQSLGGAVTDAQVPDDITVTLANNSAMLGGLLPSAYVLVAGDTVTGALQVNGALEARSGLSVLAGGIGVGQAADVNYGISNRFGPSVNYGAFMVGSSWAVMGRNFSNPSNNATLGGSTIGLKAQSASATDSVNATAGEFNVNTSNYSYATGIRVNANANNSYAYGVYNNVSGVEGPVYGYVVNGHSDQADVMGLFSDIYSNGDYTNVIGGFFRSYAYGTGNKYGVYIITGADDLEDTAYGVYSNVFNQDSDNLATTYGGYFETVNPNGVNYGIYARSYDFAAYFANTNDAANRWVAAGQPTTGLQVKYGTAATPDALTGIDIDLAGIGVLIGADIAISNQSASNISGVKVSVSSPTTPTFGIHATAANTAGPAYALYASGSGLPSDDYAGYFNNGKVRIGSAGTETYVDGPGDLYVADEIQAGSYFYNTPQTRYVAVSLTGVPLNNDTAVFRTSYNYAWCHTADYCFTFFPVNLPHGVTVTGFHVWGQTGEASHDFSCSLQRRALTSAASVTMAEVNSSNTTMTLSDTSISVSATDNSMFSYIVYCDELDNTRANIVYIYGIRIDYSMEGPR